MEKSGSLMDLAMYVTSGDSQCGKIQMWLNGDEDCAVLQFTHYEDKFSVEVVGADDSAESRRRVAVALKYVAKMILDGIKKC